MNAVRVVLRRALLLVLFVVWLASVIFGYTLSSRDADIMRRFREHVIRWDSECDFREVCHVYSDLGSAAIRARVGFIPAGDWVLAARSMPGLPSHLANNPGSAAHYRGFKAGALSAYLHLSDIQGVHDNIERFEVLSRTPGLDDDMLRQSIQGFHMHRPPTTNPQAVRSVRRMIEEIRLAESDLKVREAPGPHMRPHIASLAKSLGFPTRPEAMTPEQQQVIFERLDDFLRETDFELWRTKQLSDLLSGVWGQSFGFQYLLLLEPLLILHVVGRVMAPLMLVGFVGWRVWQRRRARRTSVGEKPVEAPVDPDRNARILP
jgi:hypothetical protein